MGRLQEARIHPPSRRDFFGIAGTTALGLTGAALLGCSPKNPPAQDNRRQTQDSSSTSLRKIKEPLGPQDLYKALLENPFKPDELPKGLAIVGIFPTAAENLPPSIKYLNPLGAIDITTNDRTGQIAGAGRISYVVFHSSTEAQQAIKAELADIPHSSKKTMNTNGYDATLVNMIPGFMVACIAAIDNVRIFGASGDENKATALTQAGANHLKNIK